MHTLKQTIRSTTTQESVMTQQTEIQTLKPTTSEKILFAGATISALSMFISSAGAVFNAWDWTYFACAFLSFLCFASLLVYVNIPSDIMTRALMKNMLLVTALSVIAAFVTILGQASWHWPWQYVWYTATATFLCVAVSILTVVKYPPKNIR